VPPPARGADAGDQGEHEVLGVDACGGRAVEAGEHRRRPFHGEGLGAQCVFHFGHADAPGQPADPAQGAGVAAGADHRRPGQGDAELGEDHVRDPLSGVTDVEQPDPARGRLRPEPADEHFPRRDRRQVAAAGAGAHDVIHGAEDQAAVVQLPVVVPHAAQCDRAAAFMQQHPVDVQERGAAVEFGDDVLVPDLVQDRPSRRGHLHLRHVFCGRRPLAESERR
jgi:hypothetical protein